MAPARDIPPRVGRKLTKRRKPERRPSIRYPDNLKEGDDVQEDVTATKGQPARYANQSVFSMIAAAGSKVDFHARFDDDSSGSEDEPDESGTSPLPESLAQAGNGALAGGAADGLLKEAVPDDEPLRFLPEPNPRTSREKNYMSQSSPSLSYDRDASAESPKCSITPRDAPVMSRMLEAQAQLGSSTGILGTTKRIPKSRAQAEDERGHTTLIARLMEIFSLQKPEEVIAEYPCWLLKSVLLQGYLYITQYHICFYAYLPKKSNVVARSGYLSKRGRQNPKFKRYWFILKGDVLSYYTHPSDLYFPSGNIDLQYGISASLSEQSGKSKQDTSFSVVTHQRTYHFRADSHASANEWVKTLQKVIFRSHNDGDSVKISLPLENIIDIEESPVIEFAETVKIRVFDSDETYAIDEYFFSFFSFGRDALDVLRTMVDDTPTQKIPSGYLTPAHMDEESSGSCDPSRGPRHTLDVASASLGGLATPTLHESVRATLSPISPLSSRHASPRPSGEWGRNSMDMSRKSVDLSRETGRVSLDQGRRSASTSRMSLSRKHFPSQRCPATKSQGSSSSYVHSVEPGTESSAAAYSHTDTDASGSQILNRSDVFQSPTLQHGEKHLEQTSTKLKRSQDTKRPGSIQIHPPARSQTQQSPKRTQQLPCAEEHHNLQQSTSSPSLHQLVKASAYPLQKAAGFAGYLRTRSKRMSNLLATESMGYVEKVSGMWAGGRKHYGDSEGIVSDDRVENHEEEDETTGYGDRFRAHFALPPNEKLQATFFGYLHRVLPLYGKIYISNRKFCFRSLLPGTRTRMVLPLKDIENVDKEKGFRFGYSGLVIVVRGHEELFFEFGQSDVRDDCAVTLLENLESMRYLQESGLLMQEDKAEADAAKAEHQMLQQARQDGHNEHDIRLPQSADDSNNPEETPPILFDDPRASILNFKPTESLRITCLTIGSRGDVQPYIALCKGLLAEGHKPKIATHLEFEPWVRKHGIDFAPVDGNPAELMRVCVENGMFTVSFLREASLKFRGWIDELLVSAWKACQDTDILVESPSAMAGIHIAEALSIPYFRAFTMPWTRTRAYPHAFAVPQSKMGGAYNWLTYVMFDAVFWKAIAAQVNRWRKKDLGLRSTSLDKMQPNKVPFLYNFSPSVVAPPLDYSDWIRVTGYWFLDEASGWNPPKDLTDFIQKARSDGKKIVYIGFGSIVISDPAVLTQTVVESVLKADVRCILSKGWSERLGNQDASVPEVSLPPEIHQIKSAPHDWLFGQIDAAAHHGGAGTTGASLRAGIPTIIKPFFGDQFFFGQRIEDLGVGLYTRKLNVSVLSRALWEATHSERMIIKAKVLGEQIRSEDGVATAIQAIYRDMEYAKTLIKRNASSTARDNDLGGIDEESWTFIGDESDPELARRIAEWEPMASMGGRAGRPKAVESDLGA